MPNNTQLDVLNSFIGKEGNYFKTIQENENFDLGTKVLYLERAITQDCNRFLMALDKLYQPDLAIQAKESNVEFIRSLKVINDLCFNNEVKYGEFGTRAALTHYFNSLGEVDAEDFKSTVQLIINTNITELRENHEEEVTAQKRARETSESDIARQTGWRTDLDLPPAQLAQQAPLIHQVFFQPLPVADRRLNSLNTRLEQYPGNIGARIERAEILVNTNHEERALVDYNYVLENYPANVAARIGRASLYERQNRVQEAMQDYNYVLEDYPANSIAQDAVERLNSLSQLQASL